MIQNNLGATVVVADIKHTEGKRIASEINGHFVALDVSNEDDWIKLIDIVEVKYGRLDGLVNILRCKNIEY